MKRRPLKIGAFFSRVGEVVYHAVATGPVGRLFTSYTPCREREEGQKIPANATPKYSRRRALAFVMEKNVLSRGLSRLLRASLECGLGALADLEGIFLVEVAHSFMPFNIRFLYFRFQYRR